MSSAGQGTKKNAPLRQEERVREIEEGDDLKTPSLPGTRFLGSAQVRSLLSKTHVVFAQHGHAA